jgi:hypothetical protein
MKNYLPAKEAERDSFRDSVCSTLAGAGFWQEELYSAGGLLCFCFLPAGYLLKV